MLTLHNLLVILIIVLLICVLVGLFSRAQVPVAYPGWLGGLILTFILIGFLLRWW